MLKKLLSLITSPFPRWLEIAAVTLLVTSGAYLVWHAKSVLDERNQLKAENVALTNQVKVVHDVKIIHDKISALPVGAAAKQLSGRWSVQ